ncbi:MAG: hypothetical protein E7548_03930 [Ruminococcaceae bacterium]|nr:hypothetical protein [Oscillospiraceae bacterium]
MAKLSDIDKNFKVGGIINREDIEFYNIEDADKFNVFGVFRENDHYVRLPGAVAERVSEGVKRLYKHTAGGRICFKSNSPVVAISATYNDPCKWSNFTMAGSCGFDLYFNQEVGQWYRTTYFPPMELEDRFESSAEIYSNEEKEIIINMPLYAGINDLYIGVKKGSTLTPVNPYKSDKKVVFYGSSITQGGCASRPGNSYEAMLSRWFSFDYTNLGFSGSAAGEDIMADYVADLPMDVFVFDYDHNANTAEYLEKTHEKMFKKVRAKHPDIPVVFMTRPNQTSPYAENFKVILKTYENAKAAGDKNVYFVSGQDIFNLCDSEACTIDGCHPNDLGFYCMAKCVGEVFKKFF